MRGERCHRSVWGAHGDGGGDAAADGEQHRSLEESEEELLRHG